MALHVLAYNLTRAMNILGVKPLIAAIQTRGVGVSIGATRSLTADRASHADSSSQLGQHAKLRWRRRSPSAETFSHDQDPERKFASRDPHSRADIHSSGRALP